MITHMDDGRLTLEPPSLARLRGIDLPSLTAALESAGEPAYRARQIMQWVYAKGAASFDEMTNLSKSLRAWLIENAALGGLEIEKISGGPGETQKILFRADDGEFIESVLMRGEEENDDQEDPVGSTEPLEKVSLCVSSQVGCALACRFCMTGFGGFRRNLRVDEIIDQLLHARRLLGDKERISNLVFMGMGEPMLNLGVVIPAVRLLVSPEALGYATRRITVSTAGVLPGMETFGKSGTEVNLAVSLHATTQPVRDRLMPACRRWPLDDLLNACRHYPLTRRRRITFEYVLLRGINDTPDDMKRLPRLLRDIPCKVNLICYNPSPDLPFEPTGEADAEAFRAGLAAAHLTASLRRSKGTRHGAACGQLAGHARKPGSRASDEKP